MSLQHISLTMAKILELYGLSLDCPPKSDDPEKKEEIENPETLCRAAKEGTTIDA